MCLSLSPLSHFSPFSSSSTLKTVLLLHTHHLKPHRRLLTTTTIPSASSLLSTCRDLGTLKRVHASLIISSGYVPLPTASKLIFSYANFHDINSAISVFDKIHEPDTIAWNSIIKAHVDFGLLDSALLLYREMRQVGAPHDSFTLPIVNRANSLLPHGTVGYAQSSHCVAIRNGFSSDIYFCNTMIDSYVKYRCVGCARKVFDEMTHRDVVSWTSLISGFACEVSVSGAFHLFNEMRAGLDPNPVTVITMLQACVACCEGVLGGRELHCYVVKKGMLIDESVRNSILGMYCETGSLEVVELFSGEIGRKDIRAWSILISFYSLKGDIAKISEKFNEMQIDEVPPSAEMLTSIISAFSDSGNLIGSKQLHCFVVKTGIHDTILQTSLLNCYAKCGQVNLSAKLFDEISCRNAITWCAMLSGFIQNGSGKDAIELFYQFQNAGFEPGVEMLACMLVACTETGALRLGKQLHAYLIRKFHCSKENIAAVETSILNLYIRCGSITSAKMLFGSMIFKDTITWTSMIEGCAIHGLGFEAIELFHMMVEDGIQPNEFTFLSLLSACSHCGLLRQGCEIFNAMKGEFGIKPNLEHYTCIVDLLGRSGKLKEAAAVIFNMTAFPDGRIWGALLSSSSVHGNNRLGQYAAEKLVELEPGSTGYHILLSNIKAGAARWDEVEQVRRDLNERDLKKRPGWSCIEAKGGMHGFVSGDESHPQAMEIYDILRQLNRKIRETGCLLVT